MKSKLQKSLQKVMVLVILVVTIMGNVSTASAADQYLTGADFNKANLTYYISTTPSSSDVPTYFDSSTLDYAIRTAFSIWNSYMDAYNINLSFSSTNNISDADIVIIMGKSTGAYGLTSHTYTDSTKTTYDLSLITFNDYTMYIHHAGGNLDAGEILEIAMHEIGHSIGLAQIKSSVAAANNINSIMVEDIDSPNFSGTITDFDITNIKKMY